MKHKFLCFVCLTAVVLTSSGGEEKAVSSRMDRMRLNIGTYFLQPYARTEQHVKDLKECGIDFVVCMPNERKILDLFSKYGVGR